jgi:gliding motility-associated-like protein
MYGEGFYQVRIDDGSACSVTEGFDYLRPFDEHQFTRLICREDVFNFGGNVLTEPGIYTHTYTSQFNCDSIVELELKILGEIGDTVQAKIFEGESFSIGNEEILSEGNHIINFTTSLGCDSLLLLQLSYYTIFIPTAFSPNNDGVNDAFEIYSIPDELSTSRLTIFDRWGAQIYQGSSWDGMRNEKNVEPGVYVYLADFVMDDGKSRSLSGSVTLVR